MLGRNWPKSESKPGTTFVWGNWHTRYHSVTSQYRGAGRGYRKKPAGQPQGVGPGPTVSGEGQGRGGGGRGGRGRSADEPIGDSERLGRRQVDKAPVKEVPVASALNVTRYEHHTASTESVPLEMFDIMEPTQQGTKKLSK